MGAKVLSARLKITLMRCDPVHQADIVVEEPVKLVVIRLGRTVKIDQIPVEYIQVGNGQHRNQVPLFLLRQRIDVVESAAGVIVRS